MAVKTLKNMMKYKRLAIEIIVQVQQDVSNEERDLWYTPADCWVLQLIILYDDAPMWKRGRRAQQSQVNGLQKQTHVKKQSSEFKNDIYLK